MKKRKVWIPILVIVLVAVVAAGGFFWYRTKESAKSTTKTEQTFYVEELGRNVTYDGENYYDEKTGEYFWFNPKSTPAQWQYWYAPVSGDFGNYGWMEYDNGWYIEVENGKWEQVPDQYTDSLNQMFHFENAEDKDVFSKAK